jgi:hypothetical protein
VKKGYKIAEMAQELLCKKLDPYGAALSGLEAIVAACARLSKLFEVIISMKAMEAIEELSTVLNLGDKEKGKPNKMTIATSP